MGGLLPTAKGTPIHCKVKHVAATAKYGKYPTLLSGIPARARAERPAYWIVPTVVMVKGESPFDPLVPVETGVPPPGGVSPPVMGSIVKAETLAAPVLPA